MRINLSRSKIIRGSNNKIIFSQPSFAYNLQGLSPPARSVQLLRYTRARDSKLLTSAFWTLDEIKNSSHGKVKRECGKVEKEKMLGQLGSSTDRSGIRAHH